MVPIVSCPVAYRSLVLEILLGQGTPMILLTQVVWKVASLQLLFLVILQQPSPYCVLMMLDR